MEACKKCGWEPQEQGWIDETTGLCDGCFHEWANQEIARLQGEIEDYLYFLDGKYTHVGEAKALAVLRAALEGKEAKG